MDSTLRLIESFDGSSGVWCELHARVEKRTAEFYKSQEDPQTFRMPGPAWTEAPDANAELLREVAQELRLRGDTEEAERAEEKAAYFAREAASR
jgi:hypothetical protein